MRNFASFVVVVDLAAFCRIESELLLPLEVAAQSGIGFASLSLGGKILTENLEMICSRLLGNLSFLSFYFAALYWLENESDCLVRSILAA